MRMPCQLERRARRHPHCGRCRARVGLGVDRQGLRPSGRNACGRWSLLAHDLRSSLHGAADLASRDGPVQFPSLAWALLWAQVMTTSSGPASILVLGLGNVLCSDDGLGVAAAQALMARGPAFLALEGAQVRVMDGGTLGLALLPHVETARALILLDAIAAEGVPGSLVRRVDDEVLAATSQRLSVHQLGALDLLHAAALLQSAPERVVLLGLIPQRLSLGLARSPAVEARLPVLLQAVKDEAARLAAELRELPSCA